MALKIYGVARSRAFRTLWMAGELGIPYEHVKIDFADGGTRRPEYLAINPSGHVPAIDDDGFKLWELMAINLYLAKKFGSGIGLYPQSLEDEARVWQWSFWGMTEVERPALTVLLNRIGPEDRRDAATADEAERALAAPLKVLDTAVAGSPYLLGEQFHGGRSQCRQHSRVGAASAGQPRCCPKGGDVAEGMSRSAGRPGRAAIAAGGIV